MYYHQCIISEQTEHAQLPHHSIWQVLAVYFKLLILNGFKVLFNVFFLHSIIQPAFKIALSDKMEVGFTLRNTLMS